MAIICFYLSSQAHDSRYQEVILHPWHLQKEKKVIEASYVTFRHGTVYLEGSNHQIYMTPMGNLSEEDQKFIRQKIRIIEALNHTNQAQIRLSPESGNLWKQVIILLILGFIILALIRKREKRTWYYVTPAVLLGSWFVLSSGKESIFGTFRSATNPAFIDSAFTPFVPNVHTYHDANYFYVESKGIPTTHTMMVGISNHGWQQQVPIPQCYIDTNAWPIPLNPVLSSNPIPVDSIHFTRGAIAIAVNGVPIFNPHTNTGVDALLDGQLDAYGGHCGRADDYHYHTAPLHLYNHTASSLPIAFALDGYPVYGITEPDGSALQPLDANHGHLIASIVGGMYHYHGSSTAPYMIARFAGVVTEDTTHQLIPQPRAKPVRTSRTPLNGALITGCTPNATNNGYTLTYTLNGQTDSIVYNWSMSGLYTFNYYVNGNGISNDSVYNGHPDCQVPNLVQQIIKNEALKLFPNPASDVIHIILPETTNYGMYSVYDEQGRLVKRDQYQYVYALSIPISTLAAGTYYFMLLPESGKVSSISFVKHDH